MGGIVLGGIVLGEIVVGEIVLGRVGLCKLSPAGDVRARGPCCVFKVKTDDPYAKPAPCAP